MKKDSAKSHFVSNLFLAKKKDGGNRPIIIFKNLNHYISHHHFKMKSLQSLRDILKQGDLMCKLDLKDGKAEEICEILQGGGSISILCLCFGLAPVFSAFAKLLKIPIVCLRRVGTLIIIYLDDMLLIERTVENVQMYLDIVTVLLQKLGFVINLKTSMMTPSHEMKFLGMVINSKEMIISLSEEKLQKWKLYCLDLYQSPQVSYLQLTKGLGHLTLTIQAVLSARLNYRFLQQQQIQDLKEKQSYLANTTSKQKLLWWIKILDIFKRTSFL